MLNRTFKTPLNAAFFYVAILSACTADSSDPETVSAQCPSETIPIALVQGDATESPMLGQRVTVQGIVTLIQGNHGLYMEEPQSDTNNRTSNAIFVESAALPTGLSKGSLVSAEGTVAEIGKGRYSLTAITDIGELALCASGQELPLTDVSLPLKGPQREALEGMRIQIDDTLTTTDVYQFGRGNLTLSGSGLQFVATEVMMPGPNTAGFMANNRSFALPAMLAEGTDSLELMVSGMAIDHITGVLAHDGWGLRVSLQSFSVSPSKAYTPPESAAAGTLRIVGMNLHNYFNGDGKGAGFPTPRGAKTMDEFQQQRNRIGAAIKVLDPHVLGVMELENDGFDANSAAEDLIQLANDATNKPWAVARPHEDNTGGDKITVGIFYRSDQLEAIGPAHTLTGPEFKRSRQPIAQVFQPLPDGKKILIVINHLKSKGSCPDAGGNADQKDGQGCWNPMRTVSAANMSAWATEVAASAGTDNILILGDMNAYRNEDPVAAIRKAGFTELMDGQPEPTYSFVFFGQHGTLDYAFSSDALLDNVEQSFIWNVNAALPAHMELPQPWLRFSDHDPVVVDIRSRQSNTSD